MLCGTMLNEDFFDFTNEGVFACSINMFGGLNEIYPTENFDGRNASCPSDRTIRTVG